MSDVLEMELPAFVKGHTEWHPKARAKHGMILIKCSNASITVPSSEKPKDDQKVAATAVRAYATAHGWTELA